MYPYTTGVYSIFFKKGSFQQYFSLYICHVTGGPVSTDPITAHNSFKGELVSHHPF